VGGGLFERGAQFRGGSLPGFVPRGEGFRGQFLREGDGGQSVHRTLPGAADGATGEDETEGDVKADVDATHDGFGPAPAGFGQQVRKGDGHAIAGRAVD